MKFLALLPFLAVTSLTAAPTFAPWSYTERSLFPSAIVSTATVDWNGEEQAAEDQKTPEDPHPRKRDLPIYGDENGWLGVELFGLPKAAQVEVEISIDGFMKPSRWKGKVRRTSKGDARIFPKAAWDYEALLKVRQQRPVTATFKVTVNGEPLPDETEVCVMKSLNDCPFYVIWDDDGEEFDDFSWLFAAYVNENHPLVDSILKEALDTGVISAFSGYQSGDTEQVMQQVFAVWNVLQRRGIKYSDISVTTPSKFVVSQSVRFINDTIHATQANCVDGAVLIASILRKIGIKASLVMVPKHCFVAFATGNDDDAELVGLETTMLGNDRLKSSVELAQLPDEIRHRELQKSYKTFSRAVATGNRQLQEHVDDFESGDDPNIQLISISDARELGITPLASEAGAE
ncbi:MAG: hypothetical protein U0984_05115 [Prosthecobacter sp.]|nr:hypothetical protein [Prosthecobacter sp.]